MMILVLGRLPVGPGEDVLLGGASPLQSCPVQNLCSHLLGPCDEIIIPGKAMINTMFIFTSINIVQNQLLSSSLVTLVMMLLYLTAPTCPGYC